jgi:hypothetical protein
MRALRMPTTFRYVFAALQNCDLTKTECLGVWNWTLKQEVFSEASPGIDPRPGEEPDPEPEPDPDPEPPPPPAPSPGPDPGFPIDPYPRPVPIRVRTIFPYPG